MNEIPRRPIGAAFYNWWGRTLGGIPSWDNGAARRARAELRRATYPAEVLSVEETHDLRLALTSAGNERDWRQGDGPKRLALIAATLAAVESNSLTALPVLFGQRQGERRVLSNFRFQRIIREDDLWRLAVLLRRALPLVGNAANVGALGADLLFWGERVRTRWCFDYFGSVPPDTVSSVPEPEAERA